MTYIDVPPYGMAVFDALSAAGFEGWFVGGFVRDALMGRDAHDIDLATNAHWSQVKEVAANAGFKTYETGTKHGTLTVVPDNEHAIEVTTFRSDGAYRDGRHPESVQFIGSIEEDLKRRDFTMNAIAYRPDTGLLDPFDGVGDMRRETIRVVGDPERRFKEDALRILRACRFASQLGFRIDPDTLSAMRRGKHLLENVSQERVTHELDELLLGSHPHNAIMTTADVLAFVVPELVAMNGCEQRTKYHCYDVLEHTAWAVEYAPPDRLVRWAAFCHDMGKPASAFFSSDGVEHFYGHAFVSACITRGLAKRMLMSAKFADDLVAMVSHHSERIAPTQKCIRRYLAKMDGRAELLRSLLKLKRADMAAHAPVYAVNAADMDEAERVLDDVLESQVAFSVAMLAVDGHDLMTAGIHQGPEIGEVLNWLLQEVIEERIANERGDLVKAAKGRAADRH